LNPSHGRERPA